MEDKKHLVTARYVPSMLLSRKVSEVKRHNSGDGTLSVIDVRSKKTEPFAQSEDQEDELLSLVTIKRCVVPSVSFIHERFLT